MGERRTAREWALQLLYQWDLNPPEAGDAPSTFWDDKSASARARKFTEELVDGVVGHVADVDEHIRRYADNWALGRMSAVDRNIIRLAMFEMLYREDIPPVVTINEAVELAKTFGGDESGRFVNGVLDRARKDLHRPARTAAEPRDDS